MKIRAGASSANLGPGFDCFGLAWQLYDEIDFEPGEGLAIEGCADEYKNSDNLAYRAYAAAMEAGGKPTGGLSIRFGNCNIPVSRGLGSSAALTVAGVQAANAIGSLGMSREDMLSVATAVEGHPDNVAPLLYGGLTVSAMEGSRPVTARFPLSEKLHFTALVPDFQLSTALARSVLPDTLSRMDAVFNVSHAALLLRALETGDGELINFALKDKIHQPYRKKLIPGCDRAEALALEAGASGLCISGAGSTLLCISTEPGFTARMEAAMSREFPRWRVMELKTVE